MWRRLAALPLPVPGRPGRIWPIADHLVSRSRAVRPLVVFAAGALVVAGACDSGTDRPSIGAWEPMWTSTRDLVPEAPGFIEGGEDLCGEVLGEVRARREELLPAPTETLDELVKEWVADVEGLSLDCPHDRDEVEERVATIDVLRDAVNSAIEVG